MAVRWLRALWVFGVIVAAASADAFAEVHIEVTPDQMVTVTGRASSLRTVMEEVAFRAGANLLFYDAIDRPFGGTYRMLPLRVFLERVLHQESFLAECVTVGGHTLVSTIRVLGDPASGAARRAKGGGRGKPWQVPGSLLVGAFGSTSPEKPVSEVEKQSALQTLASRILSNPAERQGFLGTAPDQIALGLKNFPGAEKELRALRPTVEDPQLAQHLDKILSAMSAGVSGRR